MFFFKSIKSLLNVKKLSTSLSLVPNVKKHWATLLHLVYPPLNKHAIVFIFFRIFIVTSSTTLPVSGPLLLRNPPNTFAFIPLPAMSLSSLNRSNSKTFRHIMPYSAPVCEGMHYHKTGVPWQMKSIFIINFNFLSFLGISFRVQFLGFFTTPSYSPSIKNHKYS